MGERLSDEELSSVLKTALRPDVEGAGAVHRLHGEARRSRESEKRLVEALREISEGRGPFSMDHHEHAKNTIEAMKALALDALSAAGVKDD